MLYWLLTAICAVVLLYLIVGGIYLVKVDKERNEEYAKRKAQFEQSQKEAEERYMNMRDSFAVKMGPL